MAVTEDRTRAAVLAAGLEWLLHTEQPDTAVMPSRGITLDGSGDNRRYQFACGPQEQPVVTVQVARSTWSASPGSGVAMVNPLERSEVSELAMDLTLLGATVRQTWGGYPSGAGCVSLSDQPHPSLISAVRRWLGGCPVHPTLAMHCTCEWLKRGQARVVTPL